MGAVELDINLVDEYSSRLECNKQTVKYLKTLSEAFKENTTPLERSAHGEPILYYKCRKLPFRKS